MISPQFSKEDHKYELISMINRIQEQFHIEWLHMNFKVLSEYHQQNQEYQQIINDVKHYTFDEDQYDLIDEEYLDENKIEQISSKLQEKDLLDYLHIQFEILKKLMNKYFFQIYSDSEYSILIKDKYKILLIEGTKDFLYLILIQSGIIMNNKFQRCRLIIITYHQNDFSIFKRFETDINYKIYTAQVISNYQFNQIAIYTNEVLCLFDANIQHLVQYVSNNSQSISIFYDNTILQLENSINLNQLTYKNQMIICNGFNTINSFEKPYQLLLYDNYLIIYFKNIVNVIYCRNGKSLYIKKNLTNSTNNSQKQGCISSKSKLIYQQVQKDKDSFIYQSCLLNGKMIRKFQQFESFESTEIYLIKFDKVLVAISSDYIQVYDTILAKQLLHLNSTYQMSQGDLFLKIINRQFLINLNYNKLSIWKQDLIEMNFLANKIQKVNFS